MTINFENIPSGWECKRLKYAADSFFKGNGITKEEVFEDGDISCIRYGEIYSTYNGAITDCQSKTRLKTQGNPRFIRKGDILFAGTGELVEEIGKNVVYMGDSPCIVGGDIIVMRHKQDPIFMNYALNSYAQTQKSEGKAKLKVVHISATDIQDLIVLIPPYNEQRTIASFLDRKCSAIDKLIADLEEQIQLLRKYEKSLITESVTHGFDPSVPMKQVNLGWIEQIPENWNIARIADVYSLRSEKVSDKDFQPLSVTMRGIVPQLENAAKTKHGDDRKLIRKGDFVINSRSDRRGSCGISPYDGSCSLINTVLAPREEMNPRYYNWLFHTSLFADEFYKWGYGITDDLWTTNWSAMRRIQIPLPPLDEQEQIANYLDEKMSAIEQLIGDKFLQTLHLKEYRASLIYEYVTGKKQVSL